MSIYRGYELSQRSVVGGINISKDGEYVDNVSDLAQARFFVDALVDSEPRAMEHLQALLWANTQMYRDQPEVTEEQRGSLNVVTINEYPHKDQVPQAKLVDLLLTYVGPPMEGSLVSSTEFLKVLRAALEDGRGEFLSMTISDFAGGPSYINLGAWLGSQDLALRLIGLGKILGLWEVASGLMVGMDRDQAVELAGGGFLMPVPSKETIAALRGEG